MESFSCTLLSLQEALSRPSLLREGPWVAPDNALPDGDANVELAMGIVLEAFHEMKKVQGMPP
jgi:hypothetical protein